MTAPVFITAPSRVSNWRPVLSESLARDVISAAVTIARELCDGDLEGESPVHLCEMALLCGYLAAVEDVVWRDQAVHLLDLAIERVSTGHRPRLEPLFGGLVGLGWIIEHLAAALAAGDAGEDVDNVSDDPLEEFDQLLLQRLKSGWTGPYDLVGGLVGIGVYFLERTHSARATEALQIIVHHLNATALDSWGGISWYTAPRFLPEWQLEICPSGYCNLGMAHGVPGVISFLSEVAARNIEPVCAGRLVEGAVAWMLARERPPDAVSRFGSWFVPGVAADNTRVSWCYGDLGIAAALDHAGRCLGNHKWCEFARGLLDRCISRCEAAELVRDVGLCHGAFGVAHIFNRAWQHDQNERYRMAALDWYQRGLSMRQPGLGIGGFRAYVQNADRQRDSDRSLLEGSLGAALALLAAATPVDPRWDRLLLLS
jgi:hypothetical protein